MAPIATIVIDMLNPYDHEDADALATQAESRIGPLVGLIEASREGDSELIYVNDNYGDFTATSKDIGAAATDGRRPDLVEPILPPKGSLFVQKVRHFDVRIAADAVVPIDEGLGAAALRMIEANMRARVAPAAEILG